MSWLNTKMSNTLKALVLHPTFELYEQKEKAFCSSLQVAEEFGKEHKNVLADIRNLDCPKDFYELNFQQIRRTADLDNVHTRKAIFKTNNKF